jgi:hypothetical protein
MYNESMSQETKTKIHQKQISVKMYSDGNTCAAFIAKMWKQTNHPLAYK